MKNTMITIVKFNQRQNEKVFALLDQLSDAQRKADMKGLHNGSMHGAMDRILDTEIFTLNIMCGAKTVDIAGLAAPYVSAPAPGAGPAGHGGPPEGPGAPPPGAPPAGGPPMGDGPKPIEHDFSIKYEDYEELKAVFKIIDQAYVTAYETMGDEDLAENGPVPHSEMLKAMFMGGLMRGQVTQMLNECGIHSDLIAGPLLS